MADSPRQEKYESTYGLINNVTFALVRTNPKLLDALRHAGMPEE